MPQSKKSMPKKTTSKKSTTRKPSSKIAHSDSLTDKELGYVTGGGSNPTTVPRTGGRT
jgi:hypothetical protein